MGKKIKVLDLEVGLDFIMSWIKKQKEGAVLFSGPTCAGKTTAAKRLREILKPLQSSYLYLDNYKMDVNDFNLPLGPDGSPNYDHIKAYHREECKNNFQLLCRGERAFMPIYSGFLNKRIKGRYTLITPAPLVIADGLFAHEFCQGGGMSVFSVFVEAPKNRLYKRREGRDRAAYGLTKPAISRAFEEMVWPSTQYFVMPQRENAQLIIRT